MAQLKHYAQHRYFVVNGTIIIPELIESPEFNVETKEVAVATDEGWIINIQTGMREAPTLEFVFNKTKEATSADLYFEGWYKSGDQRSVQIWETDASQNPSDLSSAVGYYDLGSCMCKKPKYNATTKADPTAGQVTVPITTRMIEWIRVSMPALSFTKKDFSGPSLKAGSSSISL